MVILVLGFEIQIEVHQKVSSRKEIPGRGTRGKGQRKESMCLWRVVSSLQLEHSEHRMGKDFLAGSGEPTKMFQCANHMTRTMSLSTCPLS